MRGRLQTVRRRSLPWLAALAMGLLPIAVAGAIQAASAPSPLAPQEELGRALFFDTNLSNPPGQSCASCHDPAVGFTGPDDAINAAGAVYEGAVSGRFGNRKPPAAAYAGDSPVLYWDGQAWVGGMFWDGRATGWYLGDPLAEQAEGPFLNPLEQNMSSPAAVCQAVQASTYASLFEEVWGPGSLDCIADVNLTYERIARSIAAYERSGEVNPFTSKYDYWLKGMANLTGQEERGLGLFNGKGKCANCHVAPLFTDFTYDNLGVPRNPLNPFYAQLDWNPQGEDWVDPGLGGFLRAIGEPDTVWGPAWGKHKVPTLRNVDRRPDKEFTKAYGHNGFFKSLDEIVRFYNTRDVPGAGWPAPEVADNLNTTELGDLGLNHGEELAIVAFLKTLSDGYVPKR